MEWKYLGKFNDRSPHIRAAGAALPKSDKAVDCLKIYPIDDAIVTVLTEVGLHKVPITNPDPKLTSSRHPGIFTNTRSLLSPSIESRYQTLLRDLHETTWDSYWKKELGQPRNPIGGLPPHITSETTFGKPRRPDNPTGEELLNPPVTPYELAFNDAEFHELYAKTHDNYLPGERINRKYDPPFDANRRFGSERKSLPAAGCSMKMKNPEPVEIANSILRDHKEHTGRKLGKALSPNKNLECVKPGHRFGKKSAREFWSVAELLQPKITHSKFHKDFRIWTAALFELRQLYKRRNVDFKALLAYCKYADNEDKQWLHINTFQKILQDNLLSFPLHEILPFAACFGIYQNDQVHYTSILDLFNVSIELPNFHRIDNNYDASADFLTTNMYNHCTNHLQDNSKMPVAGIGCFREDLNQPALKSGEIRTDRENLGSETRVSTLVNPSILTNYGLSHIDLLIPRKRDYMRTLFERLGYEFPGDTFEQLWKIGQELDRNEGVSTDTFRKIMEQAAPICINKEPGDRCFRNDEDRQCRFVE